MAKTIIIDISKELEQAMAEFKNVSWIELCQKAIEDYIDARQKIGPGSFSYHHELFEDMGGYRS
jgi:hypothetical protein